MTDSSKGEALDVDALIERCRVGDVDAKRDAMRRLEEAGATEALPAVLPLLASEDEFVRDAAIHCLVVLGREHLEMIGPAIEALLADPEDMVRNEAVGALSALQYTPARGKLERVLMADPDWVVRASAAEALGELGDPGALPALTVALDDEFYPVRSYVAFAIGQLGDAAQLPVIRRRLAVEIHPMPRADLLVVALRFGDEAAFDDLLALVREASDEDMAYDVFRVVDELISERTPAVVVRRAVELGDELAALGRRVGSDDEHVAELQAQLGALAQAPAPGK